MRYYVKPIPFKRDTWDTGVEWWNTLKKFWREYKNARLYDNIPKMLVYADAIKILQDDGGTKITEFPELQRFSSSMVNKT